MECRLVIYIRPGIGGYRLTTYIRLRDEFCNTESSYDEIMSGLLSYLIFPNTLFMCAYSNVVRTFAPTPLRLPLIGSTPINHCISWTFPLCTIHLHHRTLFHHNLIMSSLVCDFLIIFIWLPHHCSYSGCYSHFPSHHHYPFLSPIPYTRIRRHSMDS